MRKFTEDTYCKLQDLLGQANWNFINSLDIDGAFTTFITTITDYLDTVAPETTISIPLHKLRCEPWFTKGFMQTSKTVEKLYRKKCKQPHDYHSHKILVYSSYRNLYNRLKRLARETYYCQILSNFKNDINNTWKTIVIGKIGKTHEKTTITEEFKINGQHTTDPQTISNEFCKFFSQISCKLQDDISP